MRPTLHVVTGILGSGKTTVLQHLMDGPSLERAPAVVVGEFAEEGLDGRLLGRVGAHVRQLAGASVATPVYVDAVRALLDTGAHDRIFVETSGVTEIRRVAAEIRDDPDVLRRCTLGRTVTVIDAGAFAVHARHFGEQLWAQVDVADVVVINKTDRAPAEDAYAIRDRVVERSPGATVLFAYMGQIRRGDVLDATGEGFRSRLLDAPEAVAWPNDFESFVYRSERVCYDRVQFGHALLNLPGGRIARFKGVLRGWDRSYCVNGLPGQLDWDATPVEGPTAIAFIGLGLAPRQQAIAELLDGEIARLEEEDR